ncbi:unnamed protein product, partial [Didymodactylos carnosus]
SGITADESFLPAKSSETNGGLYGVHGYDYVMPWEFIDIPNSLFAEQLTYVDAELLKRVLPYECLSIDKRCLSKTHRQLSTVAATIDHFNSVVGRVIATILKDSSLVHLKRAQIIEKWIDIAQECRNLKNFSSLTAILNGLSAGCIHRLQHAWESVSKSKMTIFDELRTVFGSCADRKQARQILNKLLDDIRLADCRAVIGTVPYLGLYLSDLTYVDSAFPNQIEQLINFEKHRKEFEILAQLKLYQSAANSYRIMPIKRFKHWFDNVRTYTDSESPHLRRPPSVISLDSLPHSTSIRSSPSSMSLDKMSTNSTNSLPRNILRTVVPSHSRSSSASSFLTSGSCCSSPTIDEFIVAKIRNNERTSSVLKTVLEKFGLNPTVYENYCIEQQLPEKKIVIPDYCNVFYAIVQKENQSIQLTVREKTRQEKDLSQKQQQQRQQSLNDNQHHSRTPSGWSMTSAQ